MDSNPPPSETATALVDNREARAVLDRAIDRYMAERRARIPAFVDRHFSVRGSLRLHRRSLGWDLLRAPVNALASVATAGKLLTSASLKLMRARKLADRVAGLNMFMETELGRELAWQLHTDLLELPYEQRGRAYHDDALMQAILQDPLIEQRLLQAVRAVAPHRDDPAFRQRLTAAMSEYVGSRAAAADITVALMSAATGLATMHKVTPGVAALSTSIAGGLAHSAAVHSFWAGPWAGGIYYGVVGVGTPPWLAAGVFAGMLIPAAALAAFAGVIIDPIQRKLGLHQRRLNKLLDAVEANLRGEGENRFAVRDHYVARIFDLMDWTQVAIRMAT